MTVRAIQDIGEALFAGAAGAPPRERTAWTAAEMASLLARTGRRMRLLLRLSLWLIRWVAPLLVRRSPPLGRLPLPARVEALARMEQSALAPPLQAVKALLCIVHFEHPDVQREVGFVGAGLDAPAGAPPRQAMVPGQ